MTLLKKIVFILIIIFTPIILCSCYDMEPIENISIVTGLGADIRENNEIKFVDSAEILTVKNGGASSSLFVGEGNTIFSASDQRKTKQGREFVLGSELIFLVSEERADFGMKDLLDTYLRYAQHNINVMVVICEGKCEDYFSLKPETGTMSEQLFNIIKFSKTNNFYSSNSTGNDVLLMYHQQGREIYLPYIKIVDGEPQIIGSAIFNEDKMIKKITMKETKLVNLLRSSGGKGVISILSDNQLKYLDLEGKNKVKVKVSTEDDYLKYDIFVNISGDLRCATLSEKELNKEQISKIEKLFEDKLQTDLNDEVKKIQREYGVDCLDLGKYAIAKYGRDSGYDSNEYFSNADIKVHVKVKIKSIGRNYRSHIEN